MLQNLEEQAMKFGLDINVQKTVEMRINMKGNTESESTLLLRQDNQGRRSSIRHKKRIWKAKGRLRN